MFCWAGSPQKKRKKNTTKERGKKEKPKQNTSCLDGGPPGRRKPMRVRGEITWEILTIRKGGKRAGIGRRFLLKTREVRAQNRTSNELLSTKDKGGGLHVSVIGGAKRNLFSPLK